MGSRFGPETKTQILTGLTASCIRAAKPEPEGKVLTFKEFGTENDSLDLSCGSYLKS